MSTQAKTLLTPQEYLEREHKAKFRSEYLAGEVFAMAGASKEHCRLVWNILASLHPQLRGTSCEVGSTDMRVRVAPSGLYTYPDVIVFCGGGRFEEAETDTLLNPTVIFEVLSPSTQDYDRGKKFEMYSQLDSLAEYILVSQDRVCIARHTRQSGGGWVFWESIDLEDSIELVSIHATLKVAHIYERVINR